MADKTDPRLGKRGPLPKAGNPNSREKHKCVVTECGRELRSDSLKLHYTNKVDFKLLTEIKSLDRKESLSKLDILSQDKKLHTRYFFDNKIFSLDQIPKETRKRQSTLSPFERCKILKGSISIYENNSHCWLYLSIKS